MKKVITILSLVLAGCASNAPKEADYRNIEVLNWHGEVIFPTEVHEKRTVVINYVDEDEMDVAAITGGKFYFTSYEDQLKKRMMGFTVISDDNGDCVVNVMKPKGMDDGAFFYTLGHEVYHCFMGRYHPE